MIPDFCHLSFNQTVFKHFKTISSIVVWIMIVSFIVMFPLLFVFAVPLLTAYQSTPLNIDTRNSLPTERITRSPQADMRQLIPDSSESSSVHSRSSSLHHPHKLDNTQGEIHVLVDTSQHRLFIKQKDRILFTAIASTGKGTILIDPHDPNRRWTFDTPKGRFKVLQKLEKPVWIRPDWAFIEQGDPVPEKMSDRLMPRVLGPYALGFGDGYFIHGALYSNLLGQDVTHGCIQLHPDDLQFVFETVPLGAPLVII